MKKTNSKILKTVFSLGVISGMATATVTPVIINQEAPTEIGSPSIQSVGPTIDSITPINIQSNTNRQLRLDFTYDPIPTSALVNASSISGDERTVEFWFNRGDSAGVMTQFNPTNDIYDEAGNVWVAPTAGSTPTGSSYVILDVASGNNNTLINPSYFPSVEIDVRVRYVDGTVITNAGVSSISALPEYSESTTVEESDYDYIVEAPVVSVTTIGVRTDSYITSGRGYYLQGLDVATGVWEDIPEAIILDNTFPPLGTPLITDVLNPDTGTFTVDGRRLNRNTSYRFRVGIEYAAAVDAPQTKKLGDPTVLSDFVYSNGTTTNPIDTTYYEFGTYRTETFSNQSSLIEIPNETEPIPDMAPTNIQINTDIASIVNDKPSIYYMIVDFSEITDDPMSWQFTNPVSTNPITIQRNENGTWVDLALSLPIEQPTGSLAGAINSGGVPYTTIIDTPDLTSGVTYELRLVFGLINPNWASVSDQEVPGASFTFTPAALPKPAPDTVDAPSSDIISNSEVNINFSPDNIIDDDNWQLNTNNSVTVEYKTILEDVYSTLELTQIGVPATSAIYGEYNQELDGTIIQNMTPQTVAVKGLSFDQNEYQFRITINAKNLIDFAGTVGTPAVGTFSLETNVVTTGTSGLSTGALIGIIVGSLAGIALIVLGVWFYKKQKDDPSKTLKEKKTKTTSAMKEKLKMGTKSSSPKKTTTKSETTTDPSTTTTKEKTPVKKPAATKKTTTPTKKP